MVGVGVREDQRIDIAEAETERRQVGVEASSESRQPRVDGGEPAFILDRVPVEERVAEAVNARNDVAGRGDAADPSRSSAAPVQSYGSVAVRYAGAAMPLPPPPLPPDATPKPRRRYAPRMPPAQRREQLIDAALTVILEQGYGGVSIEAVARTAGVTRPVVYDHFPNLGRLLQSLVEREERHSLEQLAEVVPQEPQGDEPADVLASGVRRFLDAVQSRPATWQLILLPSDGTPEIVREHVKINRARILKQIEGLVSGAIDRGRLPRGLDTELSARAIRDLAEEAGRMVLTDPAHFSPDRYEHFVEGVLKLMWADGPATDASDR